MGTVSFDITVSLDGFIAGPNDNVDRLHEWIYGLESWREMHGMSGGSGGVDSDIMGEGFANTGAIIMGHNMFSVGEAPWGDTPPFHNPVFVLTHTPRETLVKQGGTSFIFVTDGVESALAQARAAAGDRDISVAGGANVIQQCLQAGALDAFQVHVVPVLLGAGIRLFETLDAAVELEVVRVVDSPGVTHLKYHVVK